MMLMVFGKLVVKTAVIAVVGVVADKLKDQIGDVADKIVERMTDKK